MKALAKLAVYSGLDILHIGTPLRFTVDEVKERREIIKEARRIRSGFLPVFTKITIDISRELIRHFGKRIILMACGGFFNGNSFIWDEIEQWIEVTKSA